MIECSLSVPAACAERLLLLRAMLVRQGIAESRLVQEHTAAQARVAVYFAGIASAQRFMRQMRVAPVRGVQLRWRRLHDADWKTRWKRYWKPFTLVPGMRVTPCGGRVLGHHVSGKDIYLDTTLAFGTGLHATTRLTAQYIAAHGSAGMRFLDIGAGTGILSIVAARCGATRILALEIEREAARTARYNLHLNNVRHAKVACADVNRIPLPGRFEMVAANLLTDDLIRWRRRIVACVAPGGFLAVSGIYRDNIARFKREFRHSRVRRVSVREHQGWYAALFRA
jgi:ribosomal protein L11 methyltransferase